MTKVWEKVAWPTQHLRVVLWFITQQILKVHHVPCTVLEVWVAQ